MGKIRSIHVVQVGIVPGWEGCDPFVVTPDQVRAFLDKAVIITGSQRHDSFLYGPCSARGTMKSRYGTWHWELRNLGTGSITANCGDAFCSVTQVRNRRSTNNKPIFGPSMQSITSYGKSAMKQHFRCEFCIWHALPPRVGRVSTDCP